ncbi:MAG TPA: hypothetical protein VMV05_09825 [bacterium]|nr:hypothetical protein [bacterium]
MRPRIPFFLFLTLYLVFAFATFGDYGATWDEKDAYQGGQELYNHIVHNAPLGYLDPEHGYPYTFLLSFFAGPDDYETLHLLNLLFAALLYWTLFEVLSAQFKNAWWALAGPVGLFLNLPFLGSIPANPKDVPFAIFYFLSLAAIYLFGEKLPGFKARWAVLGVLFAFAISSRIVGFTLFPILFFYEGYLHWKELGKRKKAGWAGWLKGKGWEWFGLLATSQILCMALWPYLGVHYFQHLLNVFWLSAHFPPKFEFLFMGKMVNSLNYPWYYLPLWLALTIPLFLLILFLGSFFLFRTGGDKRLYVLLVAALALNLLLYFFLHPAVYDGLRHFLFLLPILSALAAMAFIEAFQKKTFTVPRILAGLVLLANMGMTASHLVTLHPYQYTYFNELAGGIKGAYGKYETDYWVASMKEAVEWLKAQELKDDNKVYRIFVQGNVPQARFYFSLNMQPASSPQDADYSIVMTRAGIKPEPGDMGKVIHRVEREGAPLCYILKLR